MKSNAVVGVEEERDAMKIKLELKRGNDVVQLLLGRSTPLAEVKDLFMLEDTFFIFINVALVHPLSLLVGIRSLVQAISSINDSHKLRDIGSFVRVNGIINLIY